MDQEGAIAAFELKASQEIGLGSVLDGQGLDGNLTVFLGIEGQIDRAHAPLAEAAKNTVRPELLRLLGGHGARAVGGGGLAIFPRRTDGGVNIDLRRACPSRRLSACAGVMRPAICKSCTSSVGLMGFGRCCAWRSIFSTWTGSAPYQEIASRASRRLASFPRSPWIGRCRHQESSYG